MTAPLLAAYSNGIGVVSADSLNTYLQACVNFAQLRGYVGLNNQQVYVSGQSAPGDGFQGPFYYNTSATGADDNANIIQPNGVTTGRWIRLSTTGGVTANARTPISDQNYSALTTDEWISYIALSAERTVTLPLAAAANPGQIISIGDESGNCSIGLPIQVVTQGTNKFNATATSFLITSPYSYVDFRNNGSSLWIVHP